MSTEMQHQYWITRQALSRRLGRKEDECIVSSDAELDSKLELFRNIQMSCALLQRIIVRYQEAICYLSQESSSMGRFLKENSDEDKTRAGEAMLALAKALIYTAQQQLILHEPLMRFHQELETFQRQAIGDTMLNVMAMEKARTEYRAALSWMKNISQQLDPDTTKQVEKFKRVQDQVRKGKANFDKLTLDCLQKVDLLAAARCNMLNHTLSFYQNKYVTFMSKSTKAYLTILTNLENRSKEPVRQEPHIIKKLVVNKSQSKVDKEKDKKTENSERAAVIHHSSSQNNLTQSSLENLISIDSTNANTKDLTYENKIVISSSDLDGLKTLEGPMYMDELQQVLMSECKNILNDIAANEEKSAESSIFDWCNNDKDSFLPVELLKQSLQSATSSTLKNEIQSSAQDKTDTEQPNKNQNTKSWMNLFEELDPLSNNATDKAKKNRSFLA